MTNKETMKKVIFSAAILNVLAVSNVALAGTESTASFKKQQTASYEVVSSANANDPHWFDNNGCKFNTGCKAE